MIKPSKIDLDNVVKIALKASEAVLGIYNKDFNVHYKNDNSPLTDADLASHDLICKTLSKIYPNIPILSEESADNFYLNNKNDCFWCVDPLDGTKEFIKKNDEFSINIALIINQLPILGVIAVPAKGVLYAAAKHLGAYKQSGNSDFESISVKFQDSNDLTFAVSRSHLDVETKNLVEAFNAKMIQAGSALKLAYVAEGVVDVYPRFGPTMLWDVAAGQCIIEEAGGHVMWAHNQTKMFYDVNKKKNSSFIALNKKLNDL